MKTPLGDGVFRFERLSAEERLSGGFDYTLTVSSDDGTVGLAALLGQAITVTIELPQTGFRHINGYVVSFAREGESTRHARYQIGMRPWTYLMSLGANCRVFQNKTVPEIVKQVFGDWKFNDVRDALQDSYRTLEYCVQYRESDLDFVSRLMEREGIYYFFEHAEDKHTIVLADSPIAHREIPHYKTVTFFPPGDSHQHHDDTLSTWASTRQIRSGAYSSTDFDPTRPGAALLARLIRPMKHPHAKAEVYDYPGEYSRSPEGAEEDEKADEITRQVRVRLDELQADFELARATGSVQGLYAGGLFELVRHPRRDQNQKYIVVSASYQIEGQGTETGAAGEASFQGVYTCVNHEVHYRAPSVTPRPRVQGPQTATVVGPKGQEIWTDRLGRVKVQFHWDQQGRRDENSSCWVRVSQLWAGSGWGGIHIPRINQEVIVDFLEGDPDRPIITGRVYNAVNLPPYGLPANKTQSGIKSRSTLGGTACNCNEIRFEDLKGKEELFVQAERNHTVNVKADRHLSVGGAETVTVVKTRETTVKELSTDRFQNGHNLTVNQADQRIIIDQNKVEHVSKGYELTTDVKFQLTQKASTMTFEGNDVTLKAGGTVTVESPSAITLKVGGSSLSITPTEVKVSGGGALVTLHASGVDVTGTTINLNG